MRLVAVGAVLALVAGCSRDRTTSAAPTTPTAVTPPAGTGAATCAPALSSQGGRITDPNGPYFHRVAVGQTTDGVRVTGVHHVLEHASVPDGVRAPDGRVLIYYVDGDNGSVWVARYSSGVATPIAPISINGVARPAGRPASSIPTGSSPTAGSASRICQRSLERRRHGRCALRTRPTA